MDGILLLCGLTALECAVFVVGEMLLRIHYNWKKYGYTAKLKNAIDRNLKNCYGRFND